MNRSPFRAAEVLILAGGLILSGLCRTQDCTGQALVENETSVEEALRAFGAADYHKALSLIEKYAKANPNESELLHYYVGECHYKIGNTQEAERSFKKTLASRYNRLESCLRLRQLALMAWDLAGEDSYSEQLGPIRDEHYSEYLKAVSDSKAHKLSQMDLSTFIKTRKGSPNEQKEVRGDIFMSAGDMDGAILAYKVATCRFWDAEKGFDSEFMKRVYGKLASAYKQKAKQLRAMDASPEEISGALGFVRHYSLKTIVVEATLAITNNTPKPDSDGRARSAL